MKQFGRSPVVFILVMAMALTAGSAYAGTTERVSVDSYGNEGDAGSYTPSISADGRYVAFDSGARNFVPVDTENRHRNIFVHDRATGITEIVSVSSEGMEADDHTWYPSISADGRYVAFGSQASNLAPGDTLYSDDVFVHDRMTGITEIVSISSGGVKGNRDSGHSLCISGDGRYVAFDSRASNLAPGDMNGIYGYDIFVHDRATGITEAVSVNSNGIQGNSTSRKPSISADGRYVAFGSHSDNLVDGDTNGAYDVFVHDRLTGITQRVSVSSDGAEGNSPSGDPSISGDGRYAAFVSWASNLVPGDTNGRGDVFVHDRATGITERVSVDSYGNQVNSYVHAPSISADGRYVAFSSDASNLVPGDTNGRTDVFVHDRATGITERASVSSEGIEGNSGSRTPQWQDFSISGDGRYVVFESWASNLVPGDTNGRGDVFVRDRGPAVPETIRELSTAVEQLLSSGAIATEGVATSLISTLSNALSAQERGNVNAAENMLQAFINKVEAQAGKQISEDAAALLIDAAKQILNGM